MEEEQAPRSPCDEGGVAVARFGDEILPEVPRPRCRYRIYDAASRAILVKNYDRVVQIQNEHYLEVRHEQVHPWTEMTASV